MKSILTSLLYLLSLKLSAQHKLPVINAHSKTARIYEAGNSVKAWGINPKIALDTYTSGKIRGKKYIKFKTDIDSISVKLKQGERFDFIVLLNGKDSCITRIQGREAKNYRNLKPAIADSVPFVVNKFNTNLVDVVLNNTDTLTMNFDTGATEFSLLGTVLEKKVKSKPELYNSFNEIKLGDRSYYSKIYDTQNVGDQADGLMGWDLFDGYIVELNYDKNLMVIHSKLPKAVSHNRGFSKFKINYINNKPFIESKISQNGIENKNWFLFDLGYQSTVMLDRDLLKKNDFPADKMEVIKKVMLHGTQNNEIPVITANLEKLQLGTFLLRNIPAQLLGENKPMRGINIHILGNEILKRFHTFLDFQKDVVYLMPNESFNLDFTDRRKS